MDLISFLFFASGERSGASRLCREIDEEGLGLPEGGTSASALDWSASPICSNPRAARERSLKIPTGADGGGNSLKRAGIIICIGR